jgi:CubicO group peptidase (beta-lactamase class C family)
MERVAALVRRYVDSGRYPGTVTVVAHRDEVLLFDAYGRADVERDRPIRANTIFRIYSMTKPIVSLGLMQLYEQGLFQLDDPAAKYLPDLGRPRLLSGESTRVAAGSLSARAHLRTARHGGHRIFGA